MTNDELWQHVRLLQGQVVSAADGLHSFVVVRVSDQAVDIRRWGRRQVIPRTTIEAAHALGRNSDALDTSQIQSGVRNPNLREASTRTSN